MKKTFTSTTQLAIAGAMMTICTTSATAALFTFGSDNDGLAGFTQSVVALDTSSNPLEIWSTDTDSVQYRNQSSGTQNSSFLRDFPLNRSVGNSYLISGVVSLTDGYADDNNRVGMYLFGDSPEVPNQDEVGAVGLIFNMDDGVTGGAPGDNSDDNLALRIGIDSPNLSGNVARNEANTAFSQDLFGTEVTFAADISFINDGTDDLIQIDASLTDAGGAVTTTSTSVPAADYTGDYFGFVTRARARNYPDTAANRGAPWVMDYRSFSVVPEPSSFGLLSLVGGALLLRRRRSGS